jgi:hypothetical protein
MPERMSDIFESRMSFPRCRGLSVYARVEISFTAYGWAFQHPIVPVVKDDERINRTSICTSISEQMVKRV